MDADLFDGFVAVLRVQLKNRLDRLAPVGSRNGQDPVRLPPTCLGRLPLDGPAMGVELPVASGLLVGSVDDRADTGIEVLGQIGRGFSELRVEASGEDALMA